MIKLISTVFLPFLIIGFIVVERYGFSDWLFERDKVIEIAERFETSYAKGIDRQVGPDEPGWKPLLCLIQKYSTAKLPQDMEPTLFARWQALSSGKQDIGRDRIAEWTSPATPVVLVYSDNPKSDLKTEDILIVGSIGDIRAWVYQSRSDFRFLVQDIFIGILSVAFGLYLWRKEHRT